MLSHWLPELADLETGLCSVHVEVVWGSLDVTHLQVSYEDSSDNLKRERRFYARIAVRMRAIRVIIPQIPQSIDNASPCRLEQSQLPPYRNWRHIIRFHVGPFSGEVAKGPFFQIYHSPSSLSHSVPFLCFF